MKIFYRNLVIFLLIATSGFAAPSRNLTIFTEPNMVLALTRIARLYSQKSNVITSINFNSSLDLIAEIDSGAPANVFISAHSGWINTLRRRGLVDVYNIGYIASDKLMLVTSKSNPDILSELRDKKLSLENKLKILNQTKQTLIIDDEGCSSGKISSDIISRLNLLDIKLFKKLSEDKSPFLSIIANNPEYYALLLASQVKNEPDLEILATKKDSGIFYQALVIADDNMDIAREFLRFLKSEAAQKILRESGFVTGS